MQEIIDHCRAHGEQYVDPDFNPLENEKKAGLFSSVGFLWLMIHAYVSMGFQLNSERYCMWIKRSQAGIVLSDIQTVAG